MITRVEFLGSVGSGKTFSSIHLAQFVSSLPSQYFSKEPTPARVAISRLAPANGSTKEFGQRICRGLRFLFYFSLGQALYSRRRLLRRLREVALVARDLLRYIFFRDVVQGSSIDIVGEGFLQRVLSAVAGSRFPMRSLRLLMPRVPLPNILVVPVVPLNCQVDRIISRGSTYVDTKFGASSTENIRRRIERMDAFVAVLCRELLETDLSDRTLFVSMAELERLTLQPRGVRLRLVRLLL